MPLFPVEIVTVTVTEAADEPSEIEQVVRFEVEAADKHAARELAESYRGSTELPPGAERFERRRA